MHRLPDDSGIFAAFPGDKRSMLTDWLKIMMDEIARKQAERESARVEQELRERERCAAQPAADAKTRGQKAGRESRQ